MGPNRYSGSYLDPPGPHSQPPRPHSPPPGTLPHPPGTPLQPPVVPSRPLGAPSQPPGAPSHPPGALSQPPGAAPLSTTFFHYGPSFPSYPIIEHWPPLMNPTQPLTSVRYGSPSPQPHPQGHTSQWPDKISSHTQSSKSQPTPQHYAPSPLPGQPPSHPLQQTAFPHPQTSMHHQNNPAFPHHQTSVPHQNDPDLHHPDEPPWDDWINFDPE